jgi:hypothetical protein
MLLGCGLVSLFFYSGRRDKTPLHTRLLVRVEEPDAAAAAITEAYAAP